MSTMLEPAVIISIASASIAGIAGVVKHYLSTRPANLKALADYQVRLMREKRRDRIEARPAGSVQQSSKNNGLNAVIRRKP